MPNLYDTYLSLLRSAIWGGTAHVGNLDASQWGMLMRLCAIQGTDSLIYNQLLKDASIMGDDSVLSAQIWPTMKATCMQNMLNYEKKLALLRQTWHAMCQKGLHPSLLKGFALARLYPSPYLRSWGDMDIIVPVEEHQKACEVVHHLSDQVQIITEANEACKHEVAYIGNQTIELHLYGLGFHNPNDERYYHSIEQEALHHPESVTMAEDGLVINIPEPTFNLFFTFAHAKEHLEGSGMPMKQVCDLALLAHAYAGRIDSARLGDYLHQLHLMSLWQVVGWLVVQTLQLPENEWPFYTEKVAKRGSRLVQFVLQTGQMKEREKSAWQEGYVAPRGGYIGRKLHTFHSRVKRMLFMWSFSPELAVHHLMSDIGHGIRRTCHGN